MLLTQEAIANGSSPHLSNLRQNSHTSPNYTHGWLYNGLHLECLMLFCGRMARNYIVSALNPHSLTIREISNIIKNLTLAYTWVIGWLIMLERISLRKVCKSLLRNTTWFRPVRYSESLALLLPLLLQQSLLLLLILQVLLNYCNHYYTVEECIKDMALDTMVTGLIPRLLTSRNILNILPNFTHAYAW